MELSANVELGRIAHELNLPIESIDRTVTLLDEGNTVPFITRYRKDQTGGLDEEQIRQIQESITRLRLLAERKATILKSIESQGKLTPKLAGKIDAAYSIKKLEDLYLPYKPKKQTLATLARQRGLEPLAREVFDGQISIEQLVERAPQLIRVDKELHSLGDVMQGVGHLLAERFSESAELRGQLRKLSWRSGQLVSTAISDAAKKNDQVETHEVTAQRQPGDAANPMSSLTEGVIESDESQLPLVPSNSAGSRQSLDDSSHDSGSLAPVPSAVETPLAAKLSAEKRRAKKDKKKQKTENAYKDYFDYREPIARIAHHRVLAINRGERAKMLRVKIEGDFDAMQNAADKLLIPPDHPHGEFLRTCLRDAMTRLVLPALEREIRRELTERAERHAVEVFARNLRKLLLQPPIRDRRLLAIDPGFRNGCKMAVLDEFGNVKAHGVIHIIGNEERQKAGRQLIIDMIIQHDLPVIAIGNGTACRETEQLIAEIIADELKDRQVEYVIVNEAGASVYSTSAIGREELPDYDATIRGAVSIGRRLLDPLSELVKINAANIGVGLYQHDVRASHLRQSLDDVVASCVNYVGVDVNTASPALLRYVSGLNQLTARRLYEHRGQHGPFKSREQLKDVAGFGEATFVQAAGFLKISDGNNPLDATWIHPESYDIARRLLQSLGAGVEEVVPYRPGVSISMKNGVGQFRQAQSTGLAERVANADSEKLAEQLGIGKLLLQDILTSITRPGRDPRDDLPHPIFRRGIMKLDDLRCGMQLRGTVLNVVDFGVFVDIGLSDSGLVHISQLANRFVSDPHEVVGVGDVIKVWVLEVDKERRRVALTAIEPGTQTFTAEPREKSAGRKSPGEQRSLQKQRAKQGQAAQRAKPTRVKPPKYQAARRPKHKPRPATPITQAMVEGKEPMRSFSDLKQFFEKKESQTDDSDTQKGA